ncbi:MAG: universal stress protein [Phycisphaerales bacterium]|nr:universal stress protein [Phycisphaerales bacterium]
MPIKRILVTLGGTPFLDSEIATAVALGRAHGAALTGMALIDPQKLAAVGPVPLGGGAAAAELAAHRGQEAVIRMHVAASTFERSCKDAGVPCVLDFEEGSSIERLEMQWRTHDLVVAGLRGVFEYGLVHDAQDMVLQIVEAGIRPILAVALEPRRVERVMIASSGAHVSSAAMKQFATMAPYPDAEIDLVRFEDGGRPNAVPLDQERSYLEAHGYRVHVHTFPGPAESALLTTAAELKADLIVMGATHRRRLTRHLLGDTVLEALTASGVPLFLSQ